MKVSEAMLLAPSVSLRTAVQAIDSSGIQIALIVNSDGALTGIVTDGDVRRALLRGVSLEASVATVMNSSPTVARVDDTPQNILAVMRQTTYTSIPVIDGRRKVVRIALLRELVQPAQRDNLVVIMAGGIGSRLSPLTNDRPKPMLTVGAKPLLETILESLRDYGFKNFYLSVNYKVEIIKGYFGDGSRWGVQIRYLEEKQKLGTAGALGLLQEKPAEPVLVMNGDLLTKVNFEQLLDFHAEQKADATMCVREHEMQIPFGVVKLEGQEVKAIDEKPVHRLFVNAGIYVLQPSVLALVAHDAHIDMTSLFARMLSEGKKTAAFPIREYWLDVGQLDDLARARLEYSRLFS